MTIGDPPPGSIPLSLDQDEVELIKQFLDDVRTGRRWACRLIKFLAVVGGIAGSVMGFLSGMHSLGWWVPR